MCTDTRFSHLTYYYIAAALIFGLFPLLAVAQIQILNVYRILCILNLKMILFTST